MDGRGQDTKPSTIASTTRTQPIAQLELQECKTKEFSPPECMEDLKYGTGTNGVPFVADRDMVLIGVMQLLYVK
jgi:hypothetical protein